MTMEEQQLSAHDIWAQHHVQQALLKTITGLEPNIPDGHLNNPLGNRLDSLPPLNLKVLPTDTDPTVCIIGAGAAGLFTALLLDYLNKNVDGFNVKYDIFEARSDEPDHPGVGGRLDTFVFDEGHPHHYFDVGAMRYPDNPVMERVFHLFEYLDMKKTEKLSPPPPNGSLIPYIMTGRNEPWCFNGVNKRGQYHEFATEAADSNPFQMVIPDEPIDPKALKFAAESSPDAVLKETILPYINAMKADPKNGWKVLMKVDRMSTVEFLAASPDPEIEPKPSNGDLLNHPKLENPGGNPGPIGPFQQPDGTFQEPGGPPSGHGGLGLPHSVPKFDPQPYPRISRPFNYNTIEWLETFGGGTNWYDQAHSETILEFLDFHYDDTTKWWCIEGGSRQLALRMAAKLKDPKVISYSSRITGIDTSGRDSHEQVSAKVQLGGKWQGTYAGVFNSTTLGCMQQMDLTKAGLNYGQVQAIRSLGYGASAKVAMLFSEQWWKKWFGIDNAGMGHSDLPIRTTVYPSYITEDPADQSAVLLCSYEWQQDAQRISTLISGHSDRQAAKNAEYFLKERVLRDLARLHAYQPGTMWTPQEVYDKIAPLYMDHYAHDWYHDDKTYGAFAFFRPQQFGSMWPFIIAPSPGLNIIGEHASTHHAWVVGALESAVSAVYGWLTMKTFPGAKKAVAAMKGWKMTGENPFGTLPPWVTQEQREVQAKLGLAHHQQFLARLDRLETGLKKEREELAIR